MKYERPMAIEESFVPNQYIAQCSLRPTDHSTAKNGMQCINPNHDHAMQKGGSYYFGYVWVSQAYAGCTIKTNEDTKKTAYTTKVWAPSNGAEVILEDSSTMLTSNSVKHTYLTEKGYVTGYYVSTNAHYGSYQSNFTYEYLVSNVNS